MRGDPGMRREEQSAQSCQPRSQPHTGPPDPNLSDINAHNGVKTADKTRLMMPIIVNDRMDGRGGPLCATWVSHRGNMGGYPVAIRSSIRYTQEERSNPAQKDLRTFTPLGF